MLKQLLTAELEDHAKVEIQEVFTNMHTKRVSLIHLANNMLLKILIMLFANLLIFAKIAHGHHAQLTKHAKINAGLLTISTTMQVTTTH
jgi:hypothetical protein